MAWAFFETTRFRNWKVRDCGSRDIATPTIFQRHRDPHPNPQIAYLLNLRETAELADLQIHDIPRQISLGFQQHVEAVDVLIEDDRMIRMPAHGKRKFV
jgi:hypothetical protein